MKRFILLLALSLLTVLAGQIVFSQLASSQIPEVISYQGILTDLDGVPLNGTYDLTIRVYNQPTSSTVLWEETHSDVPVNNGLFNVLLGSLNPLTVLFDEPYYLGLSVNGEEELSPRLPFSSVATAFVAQVAYRLAPDENGNVTINHNLVVTGTVSAPQYCDQNGQNCVAATNLGSGGSSMVEGWPDAIICDDGSQYEILYIMGEHHPDSIWYGAVGHTASTWIRFDESTGNYSSAGNSENIVGFSACNGKNIAEIPAFYLNGGNSGGGSGAAQAFRVTRSTFQSIPSGTTTTVLFDSVEFDEGGNYDSSTGHFTAPESGKYFIIASAMSDDLPHLKTFTVSLRKNGQNMTSKGHVNTNSFSDAVVDVSAVVEANAGDTFKVAVWHNSGANMNIYGSVNSSMSGYLVGGSSGGEFGEPDFDSGWFTMQSQAGSDSFKEIEHNLGAYPSHVKLLVKAIDGPNEGFIFEGMGAAQADDEEDDHGGLIFAYNQTQVRIWAPDDNNLGSNYGRIINVAEGWGGEVNAQASHTAEVRVLVWR